jgi:hypothetical protein
MKKPYIKKVGIFSGFNVWIVNGKYVRENLDKEFTNFGQFHDFKFIPKNELWLDREHNANEQKFFIHNMLAEHRMIKEGTDPSKARKLAGRLEKRERAKLKIIKKALKKTQHKDNVLVKIHKKLLKGYSNNKVKVWIVRGDLVRSLFFVDFTEGGNDQIYSFVPDGEIWLDDDLSPKEMDFVLLHELHERNLMKKGISYWSAKNPKKTAHWSAQKIEFLCRKNPKMLGGKIRHEIRIFCF